MGIAKRVTMRIDSFTKDEVHALCFQSGDITKCVHTSKMTLIQIVPMTKKMDQKKITNYK